MKNQTSLLPKARLPIQKMGENIRLARIRRNITAEMLSQRAAVSKVTLREIERGSPKVVIGNYVSVLFALGLHDDIGRVAQEDKLGRVLQDLGLGENVRASRVAEWKA